MFIAFGFLMGAITVFCIMKIAQLERTNKQLLEKIEKTKEKVDTVDKVEQPTIKKEEKVPEEAKPLTEEKKEVELPKEETKTLKEIIKADPEFKRPEVKTPQPEEDEWGVVTKKGKIKKLKGVYSGCGRCDRNTCRDTRCKER